MENITIRIKSNSNGHYTTVDVLNQIKRKSIEYGIIFPDKPIEYTALCDLSLEDGKRCYNGITYGVTGTWNNDLCEWMERDFILSFA